MLKIKYTIGAQVQVVDIKPFAFSEWEKSTGKSAGDLARGMSISDLIDLAYLELAPKETKETWAKSLDEIVPTASDPT